MKLIIFAGGHGTRLWPLSRKNSPKQFEQMFDGKSTLQLAYDRVKNHFNKDDIYISTNQKFKELVRNQITEIPEENLFLEPAKRDLAAAIGLSIFRISQTGYSGPIAILWADHIIKNVDTFINALKTGEELIKEKSDRFVFLGEKPRYANQNLGWISVGEKIDERNGLPISEFKSWKYRPELSYCKELFASGKAFWNAGYWITSSDFVLELYKEHMPEMYDSLKEMAEKPELIEELYPTLESISFDDAIVEKARPDQAVVMNADLGWSDPGTLYALKEALEPTTDNVTQGETLSIDTNDSLLINQEDKKLLTTIGLDGFIVVNTKDAILVVHKDDVPKVKDLVGVMGDEGLDEFV